MVWNKFIPFFAPAISWVFRLKTSFVLDTFFFLVVVVEFLIRLLMKFTDNPQMRKCAARNSSFFYELLIKLLHLYRLIFFCIILFLKERNKFKKVWGKISFFPLFTIRSLKFYIFFFIFFFCFLHFTLHSFLIFLISL